MSKRKTKRRRGRFTRGPWVVVVSAHGSRTIAAATLINKNRYEVGMPIASTAQLSDADQDAANARLMAAAPDLLKALESARHYIPGHCRLIRKRIDAAISAARRSVFEQTFDGGCPKCGRGICAGCQHFT